MTPITLWYRLHDDVAEFNHVSNGHAESDAPTPNCDYQRKAWSGATWVKEFGQLVEGRVVV